MEKEEKFVKGKNLTYFFNKIKRIFFDDYNVDTERIVGHKIIEGNKRYIYEKDIYCNVKANNLEFVFCEEEVYRAWVVYCYGRRNVGNSSEILPYPINLTDWYSKIVKIINNKIYFDCNKSSLIDTNVCIRYIKKW